MPAALIYVSERVDLQLLSIKHYNIPPIVHLLLLSARPRPVSRTRTRHTHCNWPSSKGGGGKGDQWGGVQQIGGGWYAGMRGEMGKWQAKKGGRSCGETRVREGAG